MRNLGTYFDSLAYEYTLPKAIKEGYLSPIKALTIPIDLDLSSFNTQNTTNMRGMFAYATNLKKS